MGRMVDGIWRTYEALSNRKDGAWERAESPLRNWVTPDGQAGPSGVAGFKAEAGRYHLCAAWNCPWAHRALLMRVLKELTSLIDVSFAAPRRTDQGWVFNDDFPDTLFGKSALHEIYSTAEPGYSGRVSVPVLFDKQTGKIVSNESAEIVRMFGSAFDQVGANSVDLYPDRLRGGIDAWNDRIYNTLNNGVYRAGFARSQEAYDEAVKGVFETLDAVEAQLGKTDYLCGSQLTEADVRLFPTLARFDVGYFSAFKCNLRRLTDYPNLWAYARRFYAMSGIAETVNFDLYRRGYHSPSEARNPHGIVPIAPDIDWFI